MSRSKRKPLEYIKFFWRDFNRDTAHLSRAQREGYLQVICAYYDNHGALHENTVMKVSGATSEEWAIERNLIANFFTIDATGMWRHKRAESELKNVRDTAIKRSKAGKKGGNKKAENSKSLASAKQTASNSLTTEDVRDESNAVPIARARFNKKENELLDARDAVFKLESEIAKLKGSK